MASLSIHQIKEAFHLFDSNSDGFIDQDELFYAMKGLGFDDVTREDVEKMCTDANSEAEPQKRISLENFEKAVLERQPEIGSTEELQKAFDLFDLSKTGKITEDTLREVAKMLHEDASDDIIRDMIKAADLDGDGAISFEDFKSVMENLRKQ